jgi:hypothetical protein
MRHELKCWPEHFQPVIDREKTAEIRHDDRGFAVGDEIVLQEWDPNVVGIAGPSRPGAYTGRQIAGRITHVLRDFGPLADGWVVLSFVLAGNEGAWWSLKAAEAWVREHPSITIYPLHSVCPLGLLTASTCPEAVFAKRSPHDRAYGTLSLVKCKAGGVCPSASQPTPL